MYDIHDAPVFKLTFDLAKEYHLLHSRFPKMEKYTLGERTEDNLLSILTLIIDAGHSKKQFKIMPLEQALLKTETVTILFRLTRELGIITEKQYADCAEDLQRIGQMLGGWRRSL